MRTSSIQPGHNQQTHGVSRKLQDLWWPFIFSLLIVNLGLILAESARSKLIGYPWVDADFTSHLGGEYDFIANAIRHGRGFSDPFGRETGATGWMPPLIPYCLAGLYGIVGDQRETVVTIVMFIQATSLVFCLTAVLFPFRQHPRRWIFVLITGLAVAIHFYYLFQFTHDHIVLMLLTTLVWLQFSYWRTSTETTSSILGRGVFGGIVALASPVLGFAWAVMTIIRNWSHARTVLLTGGISFLLVAPWVVYNTSRLGMFCPIKSNTAYELWQAQVADDDGIVDLKLSRVHPYHAANPDAKLYADVGEAAFLKLKKLEWQAAIQSHPWSVLERIANRAAAAFIWTVPYKENEHQLSWRLCFKRLWTILITVSVMWLLVRLPNPMDTLVFSALAVGLLFLLPYVLVSYYERYDMAIFPLRLFLLLKAVETLMPSRNSLAHG